MTGESKMGFDLSKIDTPAVSEQGADIELLFNDKPTGVFVTVRGEYAPTVKRWQLGIGNKFRLKEWQDKRKSKGENPSPMTEDDLEIGLRGAAVRVAGWRGAYFQGAEWECNEANAYEMCRRHPPFADQILEASADLTLFTKAQ